MMMTTTMINKNMPLVERHIFCGVKILQIVNRLQNELCILTKESAIDIILDFTLLLTMFCVIMNTLERMIIMTKLTVERVKKSLQPFVGCEIELDVNIGRNRIVSHKGELESIYKNVFVVRVEDHDERRLSFNYVDLMTGNVVVALHKNGHTYRLSHHN